MVPSVFVVIIDSWLRKILALNQALPQVLSNRIFGKIFGRFGPLIGYNISFGVRHIPIDETCDLCEEHQEMLLHSLWLCDHAQFFSKSNPGFAPLFQKRYHSFRDLLEVVELRLMLWTFSTQIISPHRFLLGVLRCLGLRR